MKYLNPSYLDGYFLTCKKTIKTKSLSLKTNFCKTQHKGKDNASSRDRLSTAVPPYPCHTDVKIPYKWYSFLACSDV